MIAFESIFARQVGFPERVHHESSRLHQKSFSDCCRIMLPRVFCIRPAYAQATTTGAHRHQSPNLGVSSSSVSLTSAGSSVLLECERRQAFRLHSLHGQAGLPPIGLP